MDVVRGYKQVRNKEVKVLYKSYKETLKSTGFLETRNNLLDQQQDLVNYTLKYLAPKKESQKAA